jgi:ribose-phosphate pyrophosphokinase
LRPAAVHYFDDAADLARPLARRLGVGARLVDVHRFPDGESRVRVRPSGGRSAVLVRRLDDPNDKLFEVLLAVDALRRSGVRRVAFVAPYLPYMRQDRVFVSGDAISQRVLGRVLGEAVDRLITLEPHLHRIHRLEEVFPCAADALPAAPLLAGWCRSLGAGTLVVGPDEESEPWTRGIAEAAGLPFVVGAKRRTGDRRVRVTLPPLPRARRAVLVDDIASTGVTLAAAARALRQSGVSRVEAAVVHAIFAKGAATTLRRAGIERVVSCDTVVHPTNAITTARWLAEAVRSPVRRRRERREPRERRESGES